MKQIVDYAVLIVAGALVIGGGEYAEKVHGINWWLAAIPLMAAMWPLLDLFYRKRRA